MAKHIIKYILTSLIMVLSSQLLAQQAHLTISGKTLDKETKSPLAFAMLRLKIKPFGTVSNSVGEFDFHIPLRYKNDTIQISMLGYYDYEIPIREITDTTNFIALMEVRPIMLDEVTVNATTLDAKEIIAKAIENIPNNYPSEAFILHGFFRDSKKENNKYASLLEAAVRIYDREYSKAPKKLKRLLERVAIDEIRRSYNYIKRDDWVKQLSKENSLKELLGNNLVRYQYGALDLENNFEYEHIDDVFYHDKRLFIITLPEFPGTEIYIDSETFAIVRFKFEQENMHEEVVSDSVKRVTANTSINFEFDTYRGKLYLKYIRTSTTYHDINIHTQNVVNVADLHLELLINKVETENINRLRGNQTMNKYKNLEAQISKYNKAFWASYNVIKETPLDSQLIKDLEKELSLEKQFENQGNK